MNSGGGGLASAPIILQRPYFDLLPAGSAAAMHDRMQDFTIRERVRRANGNAENLIIWTTAPAGGVDLRARSLDLATRWLDAMTADPAPLTPAKVATDKPSEAGDACWDQTGAMIAEPATLEPSGRCNQLYPVHAEPRMVAGGPATNDVFKCALKPVSATDYQPRPTSAQLARLKAIFPDGVCDYAKPGVGQVAFQGPFAARPN